MGHSPQTAVNYGHEKIKSIHFSLFLAGFRLIFLQSKITSEDLAVNQRSTLLQKLVSPNRRWYQKAFNRWSNRKEWRGSFQWRWKIMIWKWSWSESIYRNNLSTWAQEAIFALWFVDESGESMIVDFFHGGRTGRKWMWTSTTVINWDGKPILLLEAK